MYGGFVFQSDYPQDTVAEFRYSTPEPIPVLLLGLTADRCFDRPNTPFFFQVRTLLQDDFLKILCVAVALHAKTLHRRGAVNKHLFIF